MDKKKIPFLKKDKDFIKLEVVTGRSYYELQNLCILDMQENGIFFEGPIIPDNKNHEFLIYDGDMMTDTEGKEHPIDAGYVWYNASYDIIDEEVESLICLYGFWSSMMGVGIELDESYMFKGMHHKKNFTEEEKRKFEEILKKYMDIANRELSMNTKIENLRNKSRI